MEINDFSHSSFDDIVFEGRNKGYGAYQLRKLEARDALIALVLGILLVSALIFGPLIYAKYFTVAKKTKKAPKETSTPLALAAKPKGEKKPEVKKIVKVKMEQSVQYRPRVDNQVTEPDPKPDSVLLRTNAGPMTQDGTDDDLTDPPGDIGGGNGPDLDDDEIFAYVDELPQFKPGDFIDFIAKEYVFTEKMYNKGKPGVIYVAFTVEKDGSVTDVKVLPGKGLTPEQDAEAVRVLRLSSGKWIPGKINGNPVRYTYRQPFLFNPEEFE